MKTKLILLLICLFLLPLGSILAQEPTPTSIFSVSSPTPAADEPTEEPALATPTRVSPPTATLVSPSSPTLLPTSTQQLVMGDLVAQETTLADLSIRDLELTSPVGIGQFRLGLPSNWALSGTNLLSLNIEYFETLHGNVDPAANLVSSLEIYMNNALLTTISFDQSSVGASKTFEIPLPTILLNPDIPSYNFQFIFRAEEHCATSSDARVFIRSDLSYIHLEYQESQTAADLATYPRPIYFGGLGTRADSLRVILPGEPSHDALRAGATIMMGLGSLAFNDFRLQLQTADQLEDGLPSSENIILVGKIGEHALIDQLYADQELPSEKRGNKIIYNGEEVAETDGILHVIPNPGNPLRNILIVTGQTDEALEKATTILTVAPSPFNLGGDTSLISEVNPDPPRMAGVVTANDVTFADLGAETIILNALGTTDSEVSFTLPFNHVLTNEAYVELKFRYSALLEPANGILNLLMNGDRPLYTTFIKDAPLDPTSVGGTRIVYSPLNARDVFVGQSNSINFNLLVDTEWDCNLPSDVQAWLAIDDTSRLHLPRQIAPATRFPAYVAWFPSPFNYTSDLSDLLLVMPSEPTMQELEQGYRLLGYMAVNTVEGAYFKPQIVFGELPEGLDLSQYNIIVVGRPSTNPFFESLNGHLPQPFAPGSDQPEQILEEAHFRLPPEFDIGILQMIHSIWSPDRLIFVITGSSAVGQQDAFDMILTQTAGYSQLLGDVVFVNGPGVVAVDSTDYIGTDIFTAIPETYVDATLGAIATDAPQSIYTVTPGPTPTHTPTRTVAPTSSPTPLISSTPVPTVPTPVPTFTPFPVENLEPQALEAPPWINILSIVTGVVIVIGVLAGFITFYRSWRRNRI